MYTSPSLETVIKHLTGLPSIGRKTAMRIALHLLREPRERVMEFIDAVRNLKDKIINCSVCMNITETDPCPICADSRRDRTRICVVEEPNDVFAIERTHEFTGLYHVLGGGLSPLDGVGPDDLKIRELLHRLDGVEEIILAMNPTTEGEATTLYIARALKPFNMRVTRIARGVPMGSDLEFADDVTLARSIDGRLPV